MKYCIAFFTCYALATSLFAQPNKSVYEERVRLIQNNITKRFYDAATGLYIETTDSSKNEHPHSFLWPLCALIQASNEADALNNTKTLPGVANTIHQYYSDRPPAPGYQAYVTKEKRDTRFYDDNQWIAIADIDAFNRTKDIKYLDDAKLIYRFMMTGFDTLSGGGLYWEEDHKNTKNTCSNGPGILIALQLYNVTKQKLFLDSAMMLYTWATEHLQSPDGLYYDNIKIPSLKIDSAKYTYNTGTMLQSAVLLYGITKDKKYLSEAQRIAKAAKDHFYKNSKMPGNYWFNVVLLRGYIELYSVDHNKQQLQFFIDDAERIWNTERDENNLLGEKKAKSLIDQAAMMEMYARLAALK